MGSKPAKSIRPKRPRVRSSSKRIKLRRRDDDLYLRLLGVESAIAVMSYALLDELKVRHLERHALQPLRAVIAALNGDKR
jgi:hypothetical protein